MSNEIANKIKEPEEKLEYSEEGEDLKYLDDTTVIPPDDVVAYNELRSCADIYRMYDKKQLQIDPEFTEEPLKSGNNKKDNLNKRLNLSTSVFQNSENNLMLVKSYILN